MNSLIASFHTRQFLRFLVSGGLGAIANLASRYALNMILSFEVSVAIAYVIGMLVAYIGARYFVFDLSGRSVRSELTRFSIVNVTALSLVWAISVALARIVFPSLNFTWHADDIAHLIGVLVPAISSYFGHRLYTFAQESQ